MTAAHGHSESGGWVLMLCAAALGGLVVVREAPAQSRPKFQKRSSPTVSTVVEEPPRRPAESPQPTARASDADAAASLDGGLSVNPALLQSVRDNTIGLEPGDRQAYFLMLWLCRELGPEKIAQFADAFRLERQALSSPSPQKTSAEFSTFADILRNPDACRGRPVQWQGRLRRLVKFEPGENEIGVRHVYEGWLYDERSQHNPTVVLFTRKPKGLPLGGDLDEDVRCAGYFLKLYGYEAQDATRKAPLVVAGELEWMEQPSAAAATPASPWLYGVTTLLALGVGSMFWISHRGLHTRRTTPELCTMPLASPE